jgi:hypothetical protein
MFHYRVFGCLKASFAAPECCNLLQPVSTARHQSELFQTVTNCFNLLQRENNWRLDVPNWLSHFLYK